jgi:LmbE family N-acetylglucosaminyl deacetylase/SAM-dependent methyltransferase
VVTFRHDESGTPEEQWATWDHLRALPEVAPDTPLVLLAAHPDDETLGAGGLLALAARAGADVDVVIATDGEASHPDSPTYSRADLAAWRAKEVEQAVGLLAPNARLHLLHLPDGELDRHEDTLARAIEPLVANGCRVVAPWRGDAHPDHEAAGRVAAGVAADRGAELLEYPVWGWHWSRPGDVRMPWPRAVRLPLDADARAAKSRAVREHRSQVEPLSPRPGDEVLLSPQLLAHFARDHEVYFRTAPTTSGTAAQTSSLDAGFFDDFYAAYGDDPWGFTDRWYERRKRALTLASLPRDRFGRAFEPGCSIGVLTAELAARCDHLLALDPVAAAVNRAAERTAALEHVEVRQGSVPADWPDGAFDLVVLSEVGYYCGADDLVRLVERTAQCLTDDGVVVACHWRHPVEDYPVTGDAVHEALLAHPHLALLAQHVEDDFRLDVLVRPPACSVAVQTGLLS